MSKPCFCGSGLARRELYDARHIFVSFVCDKCEASVRAKYRDDIFTDPSYPTDEPVDDYCELCGQHMSLCKC